jgi:NAD(P)-dependent dehydrogenase (short-subunit alcohol dehydrogenase family)
LTHLLLPTLRRSAPSRIVNVASIGQAPIDFDDVMLTREYDGRQAYGQSKLALVMLTFDLARGTPGYGCHSQSHSPRNPHEHEDGDRSRIAGHSTVEEGAEAVFHLATSSELIGVSGTFFDGRREARARPALRLARTATLSRVAFELTGQSVDITH